MKLLWTTIMLTNQKTKRNGKILKNMQFAILNQGGIENVSKLITSKGDWISNKNSPTKSPEPYDLSNSVNTSANTSKRNEITDSERSLHPMFIAVSLGTLKYFNNGWMVKIMIYKYVLYIHTEYYSAIKNDEVLLFVTTWLGLKGIILNEI